MFKRQGWVKVQSGLWENTVSNNSISFIRNCLNGAGKNKCEVMEVVVEFDKQTSTPTAISNTVIEVFKRDSSGNIDKSNYTPATSSAPSLNELPITEQPNAY